MASAGRTAGHLQEPLLEDEWPNPVIQVRGCVAVFYVLGTVWLVLDPKGPGVIAILTAFFGTLLLRHDPRIAPCMNTIIGALPLPCPSSGPCSCLASIEGGIACVTPFLLLSVATAISGLLYTLTLNSGIEIGQISIFRPFVAMVTSSLGVYAATLSWHIRSTMWRPHGGHSYFEASVASAQLQRAESPPGLELPYDVSQQGQHRATQPLRQQPRQQQQRQQQQQNLQQQEEEELRLAIERSLADQGGTGTTAAVAQTEDSGATGGPRGPMSSPGQESHRSAQDEDGVAEGRQQESASDIEIEISDESSAETGNNQQKDNEEKDNEVEDNEEDNNNRKEEEQAEPLEVPVVEKQVLEKQIDIQHPEKVEEHASAAMTDLAEPATKVGKSMTEDVCIYPGFTEHAHRLVFPYEDRFAPDAPRVLTVMPSGVIETNEILKPQKEDALIAFTYPQTISDELAESPALYKADGGEDDSVPKDTVPKVSSLGTLRDTAFVWRRDDGTNALVQTWPTNLNENFRKTFEISEGTNPDSEKFQPQAVSEFQESMARLFGPAAAQCPILFCHKKTVNTSPAIAGISEEVLAYMKGHTELMRELAILSIDSEGLGFVADGTSGDGKRFEKHFTLTAGEHCVVYKKAGWDTMGCIKPLHQFLRDAELHEPQTEEHLVGMNDEYLSPQDLCIYPGFTEHAYRLVFPFEDRFAPAAPRVLTVMPSGVIETNEILKPQKEDALIAFTYPQSISDELAESAVSYKADGGEDETIAKDISPKILRDTAFVWRRDDGTNALVQTWPTNLNEKFRKTFEISEGTNPDSDKFQPQAVSEFQESMARLFGPAAADCPILFCHKKTVNTSPAVSGSSEDVLAHIKEHPELMRELAILSIDGEGLGFVADGTSGDGKKFEKHFTVTASEHCVVYKKAGWDTMGCVKPLHQFLRDAELHEPPTVTTLPAGVNESTEACKEVCIYPGFTEHAYRLVFPFEDRFASDAPRVLTVMPSGVVETNAILKPKKENALIAFTYPQSVSDEIAENPVSYTSDEDEDDSVPISSSPQILRDTAFVWRREDGTNALVQTWPTNLNEKFRKTFEISEGMNPDSEKFQPQAVSEFQECMLRLFGPSAGTCPVLFCHKKTVNESPAVSGVSEKVLAHVREHPELMRELAILSIDSEGLGFVADGTSGDGKKFEKHFTLTAGEHCVVYRKAGWDTMGCTKPLHQFLRDAELHEPPTMTGPASMNENAAESLDQDQEEDAHDGPAKSLEIMVRLPNGRRMRRIFQSTDKVAALYEAVDAECNESGTIWPGVQYLLATSHPRSAYNNRDLTLAQAGIANQVMLHIEKPKPQPQQ